MEHYLWFTRTQKQTLSIFVTKCVSLIERKHCFVYISSNTDSSIPCLTNVSSNHLQHVQQDLPTDGRVPDSTQRVLSRDVCQYTGDRTGTGIPVSWREGEWVNYYINILDKNNNLFSCHLISWRKSITSGYLEHRTCLKENTLHQHLLQCNMTYHQNMDLVPNMEGSLQLAKMCQWVI